MEGALRTACAHRAARGSAAVRLSNQAREAVRLRRRQLHAGRRAADAEVLPHRHGHQPAERNAAAAVSRSHPDPKRIAAADQRALPDPQRLPGSDAPGSLRALPVGPARAVRALVLLLALSVGLRPNWLLEVLILLCLSLSLESCFHADIAF